MKIFLVAFRGTGGFDDPRYVDEPGLIKAGHVGIQLEGDNRIWGFHPTLEAEEAAGGEQALINLLKNHIAQPGRIYDDGDIFKRAYILNVEYGEATQVFFLTYDISLEEFQKIKTLLEEWYNIGKQFMYNFPDWDGSFSEEQFNCATFPKLLRLPIPTENGNLATYIAKMKQQGAVKWTPASNE